MGKMKGLFAKNKKAAVRSNHSIAEEKEMAKPASSVEKARFTFLIEDAFQASRLEGVMALGNLHGKVKEGDTAYLYQSMKPPVVVTVMGIEIGPRSTVEWAKNQQVGLCLSLPEGVELSKYSVVSNILQQGEVVRNMEVENPRLLGLSMEYQRLHMVQDYFNVLLYELCQSYFVVPFYMDRPPIPSADGSLKFEKDAKVGFPVLQKEGEEKKSVLPVFTDQGALWKWKGAFHKDQPKQIMAIRLPDVIAYVKRGHAGFVLNPFGPVAVYLPAELLVQIEATQVYKEKFGRKEEKPQKETAE